MADDSSIVSISKGATSRSNKLHCKEYGLYRSHDQRDERSHTNVLDGAAGSPALAVVVVLVDDGDSCIDNAAASENRNRLCHGF